MRELGMPVHGPAVPLGSDAFVTIVSLAAEVDGEDLDFDFGIFITRRPGQDLPRSGSDSARAVVRHSRKQLSTDAASRVDSRDRQRVRRRKQVQARSAALAARSAPRRSKLQLTAAP